VLKASTIDDRPVFDLDRFQPRRALARIGRQAGIDPLPTRTSTVRPDGRPHVTPLIAVWHAGALWFATGPEERKARNLAENPSCVLTPGRSDLVEERLTSCSRAGLSR
jgi:hypothetical protein